MPSDRRGWRAVLLATGIVCATTSAGCFTSSFARRAADTASERSFSSSANADHRSDASNTTPPGRVDASVRSASVDAADIPAAATIATPFLTAPGSASSTPAAEFPLELRAVPTGSNGKEKGTLGTPGQSAPPPEAEPAPPASTPLLDAAIKRVADITREQREAIASAPVPDSAEDAKRPQAAAPIAEQRILAPKTNTRDRPPSDQDVIPLPERISRSPEDDHPPAEPPSVKSKQEAPLAGPPNPAEPKTVEPKRSDVKAAESIPDEPVSELAIGDLRFCRKVLGFGSFEPLATDRVTAGQRLLLYCELTGIQYEERGDDFVSRISSRVEVKPAGAGPVLWSRELGDAQDVCRRRRRDYYVNYRVELPKTLAPGSYHLRLIQTDLVAGSATSGEIPFEITR
jgi:hypothetical protein